MERTTFFEQYRLGLQADGSRIEISRQGPVVTYKASDLRSGAPVALTLLPVGSVDSAARDRFEEQARATQLLDHINIAKIVAFGVVDDQFAFVSEYPQGETIGAWISAHGPIPPDAVLRIALQVVSALSAANFHGLTHPDIQPSNLMIVPGRTIEGGWPFVKVMNFGLAGLKLAATDGGGRAVVSEFASPEQLQQGTVDFRSEIYSLGATMCFLLTGAFYSAEPRSLQTRRFAKPLRRLIAPMLRQNPDERPQDPVLFAQSARSCLGKIERRQALQSRFGIPFVGVKAKPVKNIPTRRPMPLVGPEIMSRSGPIPLPVSETMAPSVMATPKVWLSRKALVIAAVLLAATAVAAVLLPAPVNMILRRNRDVTEIGVPVGVPDASGTRTQQSAPGVARANTNAPATTVAQNADSNPPVSSQNLVTARPSPNVSGSEIMSSAKHPAPAVASANRSSPSAARSSTTDQSPASSPIPPPKQDSSPAGETSSVVSRPPASERNQSTSASQATASPSRMIAAAEAATKPAAPAEGPQTVWERAAGESGRAKLSTQNATVDRDSPSTEGNSGNENALENKSEDDATPAPSKPRHKSKAIASTTTHEPQASEEDSTPFLQDNDDAESRPHRNGEAARPPRNSFNRSQEIDGSRRSQTSGTVHARYVGTTPNGDLILRLPSGETAIVSPRAARLTVAPRHRVRRVVERHSTYLPPPPPPYLPGN